MNLLENMLGTAFNVLQEQDHPDLGEMLKILKEVRNSNENICVKGSMFDLRHRRIDGTKLV